MIIVIDAYNLLRAIPPYKKTITEQERKQFIAQLGRYGRLKGHKIVLIFDGGLYEWPTKEKHTGVEVVYSGIHATADDYIRGYVKAYHAKDLLLVTSDRELNNQAAAFSVPSIDSIAFFHLLQEAKNKTAIHAVDDSILVKTTRDDKEYIDMLMKQSSKIVPEKAEDIVVDKRQVSKKKQESKEERALLKKLRKL